MIIWKYFVLQVTCHMYQTHTHLNIHSQVTRVTPEWISLKDVCTKMWHIRLLEMIPIVFLFKLAEICS